jgi:hypothetical protein
MGAFELAGQSNKTHHGAAMRDGDRPRKGLSPHDYFETSTFFTHPEPLPDSIFRKPLVSSPM